jgi:alkylation response protein AidB-like acyl-CoA dehydrogenase
VREWDGYGMKATQSHAFRFESAAATRVAWPHRQREFAQATAAFDLCAYSAVAVGIVQAAFAEGRPRTDRSYERVEWGQARVELWLIEQAYEGMMRAVETGDLARATGVEGKVAIAQLGERALERVCRVHGGSAYSRALPYRAWADDVRALGLLRPPWGAAFERLASG